jgi:DNA ligase (NAD+)
LDWLKQRKGKDGKLIDVKFGERNAHKLIDGIEQSRHRGLAKVLSSITIRHVGPTVAAVITAKYHTIELLRQASVADLADLHEIGDRIAKSLHEFLHSDYGQKTIDDFVDAGVKLSDPEPVEVEGGRLFEGKTIVVTGTLKHYKRDEIKKLIKELGGRASGSISKNTDFLIAGEKAGSKLTKANELGIRVLTEEDFQNRVADEAE